MPSIENHSQSPKKVAAIFWSGLSSYFASGWAFLVPYLLLYSMAWVAKIPLASIRPLFWGLHALNLVGLVVFLSREATKTPVKTMAKEWGFWLVLALVVYWPGAYLEYPSDPWEHLRRIFEWRHTEFVTDHIFRLKFTNFWASTFLGNRTLPEARPFLDLYSAFWQWLTCYQVYRFAQVLGFDKKWAKLNVVGFLFLFGVNVFNIRYYAISSSLAAYICFLRLTSLWWEFPNRKKLVWLESLLLFWVMLLNHVQAVLFSVIGLTALALNFAWENRRRFSFPRRNYYFGISFLLSCGLGTYLFWQHPEKVAAMPVNEIHPLGFFRIWMNYTRYREAYGVFGLLGLLLVFVFRKNNSKLAFFCFLPSLFLLYPLTSYLIVLFSHSDTPYRILFAAPLSVAFLWGLRELFQRLGMERLSFALTACAILLFAYPKSYPWRGKLYFAFYRPPAARDLRQLDPLAEWLGNKTEWDKCPPYTDSMTEFYLATARGWRRPVDRLNPFHVQASTSNAISLFHFIQNSLRPKACGFLSVRFSEVGDPGFSQIGKSSHHWPQNRGDIKWHAAGVDESWNQTLNHPLWPLWMNNIKAVSSLSEIGQANRLPFFWRKISVPPFYDWFVPVESLVSDRLAHL